MPVKEFTGIILLLSAILVSCGQAPDVESGSIEEIREELDQILAGQFDRVSEFDRTSAILVRMKNMHERHPEMVQAQLNLPSSEIEFIHAAITNWLESPDREGDNRISKMCTVWRTTSYRGADRIDAALLAYEREISSGYAAFTESRIRELLSELEFSLSVDSWSKLSTYVDAQVSNFRGKISHSFFTSNVRKRQDFATMEYHCGE